MKPNIRIYAILFVIGLAVSYFVSESHQDQAASGQKWLSLPTKDFRSLRYQDGKAVVLEVSQLPGNGYWAKYQASEKESEEFKVRGTIDDLIQFWSDLRVLRVIGSAEEAALKDFELETEDHALHLQYGDKEYRYVIGKKGFQSQDHFILDQQKNQILMISRRGLQPLQNAKNEIYERDILKIDLEKIDRIEVEGNGKKLVFKGQGKSGGNELRWLREGIDADDDETASSWMNRMLRLQIRSYEHAAANSDLDQWERVLHFRFFEKNQLREDMMIRSSLSEDGQKPEYRLQTKNTYAYVRLFDSRLETLLKDFEAMDGN